MGEWEATLRAEFVGADGSFLTRLRCDMVCDRAPFTRMVTAMEGCAAAHEGREAIERWVAEGFWFAGWFVPEWSGHPNFGRPDDEYHRVACQRLHDLAWWLFMGHCPRERSAFEPL